MSLPTINSEDRRESRLLREEFEEMRPHLLGAVLDAVVLALAGYREVRSVPTQRMADFAAWTAAASPAFGGPEALDQALETNSVRMAALTLESNPAVATILELLEEDEKGRWQGNAGDLLKELNRLLSYRSDGHFPPTSWPKTARGLGGMLRRLAPALRGEGVMVDYREHGRRWTFTLQPDGEAG